MWQHFSKSSLEVADEVYYITPHLWNGRYKPFLKFIDGKVVKVDLSTCKNFNVSSPICLWHANSKENEKVKILFNDEKELLLDSILEINYIPVHVADTLSIHRKGWDKNPMGIKYNISLHSFYCGDLISETKTDEFKYPVYTTGVSKMKFTNEEGIKKFGELYNQPKIFIGITRDNTPFFDRKGEYISTHQAHFISGSIDYLEARYKHLQSKLAKFWFYTGRQEVNNYTTGMLYHAAIRLFPDIPLSITDDEAIYEWLGLTDDEIVVVEKYAKIIDKQIEKRLTSH